MDEEPSPDADALPHDAEALRHKVATILAGFHGKTTEITNAGRENMRGVNRLGRLVTLRLVSTDRSFRQNVSRYHVNELDEDILIGARREGQGVWSLVAELVPRTGGST